MLPALPGSYDPTDKQNDKRLQRLYGISVVEYNIMLAEQRGVCAICSRPPQSRRLHVDHDHKLKYLKVTVMRGEVLGLAYRWFASIHDLYANNGNVVAAWANKRNEAIRSVREQAKRRSVRGLLCPLCNRGLRMFLDNSEALANASQYLQKERRF